MASISERNGVWRAQIRRVGHKSISRSFDTKAAAQRWADEYEQHIENPVQQEKVTKPLTLANLMDRYATEISPKKKGCRWEQIRLDALQKSFSDLNAETMDAQAFAQWRDVRLKQVKGQTVNRELNLISSVITQAMREWGLKIPANPTKLINRPPNGKARTRRVSDQERQQIFQQLEWDGKTEPKTKTQYVAWGFAFCLETMMRQGEMLSIRWKNVFPKRVYLPDTKNGDSREVPLNTEARRLIGLLTQKDENDFLCPINAGTFGGYFRRATKAVGIKDLHFHDTRREALTRASKKLDMLELMKVVGHRDTRSVSIYYAPDVDDLADKLG